MAPMKEKAAEWRLRLYVMVISIPTPFHMGEIDRSQILRIQVICRPRNCQSYHICHGIRRNGHQLSLKVLVAQTGGNRGCEKGQARKRG